MPNTQWQGMKKQAYLAGKTDLAMQMYTIIKQHKNEDWRDLLMVLKEYLKEEK